MSIYGVVAGTWDNGSRPPSPMPGIQQLLAKWYCHDDVWVIGVLLRLSPKVDAFLSQNVVSLESFRSAALFLVFRVVCIYLE